MLDTVLPVLICLGLVLFGFSKQLYKIFNINRRIKLTNDYRNGFIDLINKFFSEGLLDEQLYFDLTESVNLMQAELGQNGLLTRHIDEQKKCNNYKLLFNLLPELRFISHCPYETEEMRIRFDKSIKTCDNMLMRHLETLKKMKKGETQKLINPFFCFSSGIKTTITFPISVLSWIGVIPDTKVERVQHNIVIRVCNTICLILGLVSSIVTICIK